MSDSVWGTVGGTDLAKGGYGVVPYCEPSPVSFHEFAGEGASFSKFFSLLIQWKYLWGNVWQHLGGCVWLPRGKLKAAKLKSWLSHGDRFLQHGQYVRHHRNDLHVTYRPVDLKIITSKIGVTIPLSLSFYYPLI